MVRRIVTGHNAAGRAVVLSDGGTPPPIDVGRFRADHVWIDDPTHAPDPDAGYDPVRDGPLSRTPPPGGSLIRLVTFLPEDRADAPAPQALAAARQRLDAAGLLEPGDPAMHTTRTIDYGIVLQGEIILELDSGETSRLRAGDVLVQRGTRHAWRNTGDPCTICFVVIDRPGDA